MQKEILNKNIENTKIEYLDINTLIPYVNNPRKNLNVDKVASSILEFGFQQPIVVDKNKTIIVGHTRYEASKKLGLNKVPVLVADLTEAQSKAYRIADNRLNEDSLWDNELLDLEIKELETLNFDKTILGFDQKEIEDLFKDVVPVFEPANNNFQNVDMGEIKAPNSQVRMVQLFLDSTSEPKLKEMIDHLKSVYKIDNLTDTVFKAVENEYNNSKANT
jgi:hypothetical protein